MNSRPANDPMARRYALLGLVALVPMTLNLAERGVGLWALAAPAVAAAGLAFRWSSAPVFVVLATAIALMVAHQLRVYESTVSDALLAATVLAYVLAQSRITALSHSIFPPDPRPALTHERPPRRGLPLWLEFLMAMTLVPYMVYLYRRPRPKRPPIAPEPRDGGAADRDELFWAGFTIALCVCAAVGLWGAVARRDPPFNMIPMQWNVGVMLWSVLASLLLARVVVGLWAGRAMTVPEARLLIADTLWRETRREQQRLAHWTAAKRIEETAP